MQSEPSTTPTDDTKDTSQGLDTPPTSAPDLDAAFADQDTDTTPSTTPSGQQTAPLETPGPVPQPQQPTAKPLVTVSDNTVPTEESPVVDQSATQAPIDPKATSHKPTMVMIVIVSVLLLLVAAAAVFFFLPLN